MLRSLWTGATGMIAQQTAVDTISNNLSNVNTVGYKKETSEFKTLLYSKLQTKTHDNEGNVKPVIGQVGAGVRLASVTSRFTQGAVNETGNLFDFAISGDGFFRVMQDDGTIAYTRNGSFITAIGTEGITLATSDGYPVLDKNGEPIVIDSSYNTSNLIVDDLGRFYYKTMVEVPVEKKTEGEENTENVENAENQTSESEEETEKIMVSKTIDLGIQFGLAQFINPSGLEKTSNSLFIATEASGDERLELQDGELKQSTILSQHLEASNVSTVDEMVNLIVAQRAYEMNSKVISASDEMLQLANNIRG